MVLINTKEYYQKELERIYEEDLLANAFFHQYTLKQWILYCVTSFLEKSSKQIAKLLKSL